MCKINYMDIDMDLISFIENKLINGEFLNDKEAFYFLSYASFKTRSLLADFVGEKLMECNFKNTCNRAQAMLKYYFDSLGLRNVPIQTNKIFFNTVQHSFIVVYLPLESGVVSYIVDPTYNQFFENGDDNFVYSGNYIRKTPSPGYLISKDSKIADSILRFGFIKMDKDSAKEYGDSFYLTQIGITKDEYDNLFVPGNSYIKFFEKCGVDVNKSISELASEGLLLEPTVSKKNNIKNV